MRVNTSSISVKLIAPIMLILILVATLLVNLPAKQVKNHWKANTQEVVYCDVDIVMNQINNDIQNTKNIAKSISDYYIAMLALLKDEDPTMISLFTTNAVNTFKVDSVAIYGKNHNLISDKKLAPYSEFNTDISLMYSNSKEKYGIKLTDKNDVIAYTIQPVIQDGKTIAVIEINKLLSSQEYIEQFPSTVGCEFTFIRNDTRIHTTIDGQKDTKIKDEVYEKLKNRDQWAGIVDVNGETYTAVYWPYPTLSDLYLFVGENTESMNDACREITNSITFLEIVANLFILLIFIVLIYFFILKPLNRTQKAIDELSSGDADLTYRLPVHGKDEIAKLCGGVNKFIDILQNLMRQLKNESETINNIINELGSTSQETASATTEIMANIESVKNQSKNQSTAVTNTSSIINESNDYMSKLKNNIIAQTSDISESSSAIEEMVGNIQSVSTSTNQMSNAFKELEGLIDDGSRNVVACSEVISQVEEKSKLLGEANNTIKAISSQTNLLAMNAMIESAHAGEAGKGFAVVADEIRKLAENSGTQAKAIEDNIKEITKLIEEGGRLSGLSQKSFATINNQVTIVGPLVNQISAAMEEQTTGSSQILESLSNMKEESISVDDSSKQLDSGIQNINRDMSSVTEITSTILGSMDEMAAGSQQISRATQQVSDLALKTKDAMTNINDMIGKFKVE